MGMITIAIQALRSHEYFWTFGFLALTALFNPFVPILKPASHRPLSFVFVYIATFLMSLAALNMQAVPPMSQTGSASSKTSFRDFVVTRRNQSEGRDK
jgi:predicted membrane channel-forming protein YqfA (hemolysin III family)